MQPLKKFLKALVRQYFLNGVKCVPQFVMTPGFVNEILARVAGLDNCGPAFAARDDMVPSSMELPLTKHASFGRTSPGASDQETSRTLTTPRWIRLKSVLQL